jgi:hypothetical protein
MVLVDYIGIFLHFRILLTDDLCISINRQFTSTLVHVRWNVNKTKVFSEK